MRRFNVEERSRRLGSLIRQTPRTQTYALANEYTLSNPEQDALRHACLTYLWHCANVMGKHIPAPDGPNWFNKYAESISLLPNITPNGLVLPKLETQSSYNFTHSVISRIMSRYFIDEMITGIHFPINFRLIDGRPNQVSDSRPRSSTKFHSDIWAAEPSNSIAIFIPVLGDITETTIEFLEPIEFPDDLQRPLDNFNLGQHFSTRGTPYPSLFSNNNMLTTDALCLHRTIKNNGGFRLSIDFRVLHKTRLDSDIFEDSPRLKDYILPNIWYGIGEIYSLVSRASINDTVADRAADGYASKFELRKL